MAGKGRLDSGWVSRCHLRLDACSVEGWGKKQFDNQDESVRRAPVHPRTLRRMSELVVSGSDSKREVGLWDECGNACDNRDRRWFPRSLEGLHQYLLVFTLSSMSSSPARALDIWGESLG